MASYGHVILAGSEENNCHVYLNQTQIARTIPEPHDIPYWLLIPGGDLHMVHFSIWHILIPIETFAKVEVMSESRSIADLPIIICCSFDWIPEFFLIAHFGHDHTPRFVEAIRFK